MSLNDPPHLPAVGPAPRPVGPAAPAGAPDARGGEFGNVLDLQAARARRAEPLPAEVRDDMARAAELVERLAFEGRHIRFETHKLSGQIVAGLCDEQGAVVRQLSLTDVVLGNIPDGAA